MKIFKRIFTTILLSIFVETNIQADLPYFIDFKFILNNSDAGKKAQKTLKNDLDSGFKNLEQKENKILEEEKKIIQQKKSCHRKIIKHK